jgi:dolichol kinase
MSPELRREILRKLFHFMSLAYLAAYVLLGRGRSLAALGVWIVIVAAVETLRLRRPALNDFLMRFFGGIHRESEAHKVSGVLWTAIGCWLSIAFFGGRPEVVTAALLCLAFGDTAAALVGRSLGRVQIGFFGRKKTLEGSMACLAACLLTGWACGFRGPALWLGALTATAVELLPVPVDDNLWLPFLPGAVYFWLTGGAL